MKGDNLAYLPYKFANDYLDRFRFGLCVKALAAATLDGLDLEVRMTLLAILPTRLEVTSFLDMAIFPFRQIFVITPRHLLFAYSLTR